MSKKFKTQDYFRYKKLGKRWRKPVGHQSKLRIKKGGSGMHVSIGYRTPAALRNMVQGTNAAIVHNADNIPIEGSIYIASGVGAKKTIEIGEKAKSMNVRILNMKKLRAARIVAKRIEQKKTGKKEEKIAAKETKQESKVGPTEVKQVE